MNIYEVLNYLNIAYEEVEHKPVYTIEEARFIKKLISGTGIKNLFLTNHKDKYYLVLIEENKQANLKDIAKIVNEKHLSFASLEDLKQILNLDVGSVTPLGLINDKNHKVIVLIDKDLTNKNVLIHPNINIKTLSLEFQDLIKIIDYLGNKWIYF